MTRAEMRRKIAEMESDLQHLVVAGRKEEAASMRAEIARMKEMLVSGHARRP